MCSVVSQPETAARLAAYDSQAKLYLFTMLSMAGAMLAPLFHPLVSRLWVKAKSPEA